SAGLEKPGRTACEAFGGRAMEVAADGPRRNCLCPLRHGDRSQGGRGSGFHQEDTKDAACRDRARIAASKGHHMTIPFENRLVPNTHGTQPACDHRTVDTIRVPDHVARSLIPGERLRYLTRDPFGGWMCRDVDPDKISAVEPNDNESIEQVEANGRDNK